MEQILWDADVDFKHDDDNDILIVIPTVAQAGTLIPSVGTLISTVPSRTRIVVSINPVDKSHAEVCKDAFASLVLPPDVTLDVIEEDGPIGFGHAINQGIMHAANTGGLPKYVVIYNDDLHPVAGWLQSMINTFNADHYHLTQAAPTGPDATERPRFMRTEADRIGIVGPVTNCAAGIQQIVQGDSAERMKGVRGGYETFAERWRDGQGDIIFLTEFLSGFCWMWDRDCLIDMMLKTDDEKSFYGPFDGDQYPVAGFEDNDACYRAVNKGWKLAIDYTNFIGHDGHQTFDAHFSDHVRGVKNRLQFYRKFQDITQNPNQQLVGAYRVCFRNVNDLHVFKNSILRNAMILDGIAILFTKNPLELQNGNDWEQLSGSLTPVDVEFLKSCSGTDPDGVEKALTKWIVEGVLPINPQAREIDLKVSVWTDGFNERDERTALLQLAESMEPDWVISIDADELFEDRLTRKHFDRAMMHPQVDICAYQFSWLNHWDNPSNVRLDFPWGDGGTFTGGMSGNRLYRVNKSDPARIMLGTSDTGLHCGNVPSRGSNTGTLAASFRMRHYGYVRKMDRATRYSAYQALDPKPNPYLVGGETYGHIIDDEGMTLRPYLAPNGIALTMLAYEKTDVVLLSETIRYLHSVVDKIILVWTGEWKKSDKKWMNKGLDKIQSTKKWPKTGPSAEMAEMMAFHGVEWVHHPLNENIGEARNAGFNEAHKYLNEGIGWALFLDPDEVTSDWLAFSRALRSMSEVTDGWGFLFKFHNLLPDRGSSYSERISMIRLDPSQLMKMNGRVHEGFNDSIKHLRSMNINPKFRYCPVELVNIGLKQTEEDLFNKLKWYQSLLLKDLEDNPFQPGQWVSLGLQFANDGDIEKAITCMQRGVLCADNSYLPFKELGTIYLRLAAGLFEVARDRVFEGHQFYSYSNDIVEFCKRYVEAPPALGASFDIKASDGVELPPFPIDEDEFSLEELHGRLVKPLDSTVE